MFLETTGSFPALPACASPVNESHNSPKSIRPAPNQHEGACAASSRVHADLLPLGLQFFHAVPGKLLGNRAPRVSRDRLAALVSRSHVGSDRPPVYTGCRRIQLAFTYQRQTQADSPRSLRRRALSRPTCGSGEPPGSVFCHKKKERAIPFVKAVTKYDQNRLRPIIIVRLSAVFRWFLARTWNSRLTGALMPIYL